MKNKVEYIHGKRTLTSEDIDFCMHADADEENERLVELCMTTNFDVDAVFGTHVNTFDNNETLSVFAYFDRRTGHICPDLKVVLWTDDGWSEEYKYTLNEEERQISDSKIMEYCKRENIIFGIEKPMPVSDRWRSVCDRLFNMGVDEAQPDEEVLTDMRTKEFNYLLSFAEGAIFESDLCCDQLRALWVAYCFHHNLDVDTAAYDADMIKLWKRVTETEEDTAFWHDFSSFNDFMCKYLA